MGYRESFKKRQEMKVVERKEQEEARMMEQEAARRRKQEANHLETKVLGLQKEEKEERMSEAMASGGELTPPSAPGSD